MASKFGVKLVAVVLAVLGAASAEAQWDKISIHGYGGWAAAYSDPYPYLRGGGDGHPTFENVEFVLLLEARPAERLRIVFAPEFEVAEDEDEVGVELLYAEWEATDRLALQFGRGRLPFGLYADIYDVGTLRPFYDLPQAIYGDNGFLSQFFDGVGLVGRSQGVSGWEVQWNAFAGGLSVELEEPFEEVIPGVGDGESEEHGEDFESEIELLVGGRLILGTPLEGLSFGLSAFAGEPEVAGDFAEDDEDPRFGDFASAALSVELVRGDWTVRAEWGHHDESEFDTDAGYLEASYRLGERWQLAGRFDSARVDFVQEIPEDGRSTLDHDEISLGLNYWFHPNFVLKLSVHQVDGNLFAHPEDGELAPGVALDERTDLVLFGTQFSF